MQYINGKKAHKLVDEKSALLVDTRSPVEFRNGTLPGAVNLPMRNLMNTLMEYRESKTPIIIFGDDEDGTLSMAVTYAENLRVKLFVLKNMNDWNKSS